MLLLRTKTIPPSLNVLSAAARRFEFAMALNVKSWATYLRCVLLLMAACTVLLVEARRGRNKKAVEEDSGASYYLWATLKLMVAFSPVLVVGLVAGCSKESAIIEAQKSKLNESCKT